MLLFVYFISYIFYILLAPSLHLSVLPLPFTGNGKVVERSNLDVHCLVKPLHCTVTLLRRLKQRQWKLELERVLWKS